MQDEHVFDAEAPGSLGRNYDVIVIGAGPAGLTIATYLGRFRRRVLVLDGGPSRASWIPESHNTPGFPHGIGGGALLARLREQAHLAGAEVQTGVATLLSQTAEGFCVSTATAGEEGEAVLGKFVVMATGVVDRKPDVPGIEAGIERGLVRVCPICDAYEAIDQKIAVLGDGDLGAREAMFLRTYSSDVTLLQSAGPLNAASAAALAGAGIKVIMASVDDIRIEKTIRLRGSTDDRTFDCLYLALGCEMQSQLAVRFGAQHDSENNLIVDAHQQTSIAGLYAVGDVVRGLNQIAVATGEAAIAATNIHKRLREAERHMEQRCSRSAN
jgi:thioredoxin reductase (NADPH)